MTEESIILNNKRFCECGCGTEISEFRTDGKPKRFVYNHHSRGKLNPKWKEGNRIDNYGYRIIWKPDHPFSDSDGYVREHRLIIEQYIKRYLTTNEEVHHKNKNKLDNRIENLQIMTTGGHKLLHLIENRKNNISKRLCSECGKKTQIRKQKYKQRPNEYYYYEKWMKNPIDKTKWVCSLCYDKIRRSKNML